jgi:hypothetical protein
LRSIFLAGLARRGFRALADLFSATTVLHPDRSVDPKRKPAGRL